MEASPFSWFVSSRCPAEDRSVLLESEKSRGVAGRVQELFHEDAQGSPSHTQPWWRVKLFVWEPVLFGTWDGVFTTCMINIFGVVLFLRTGWLVGNTGVFLGMLLVSLVVVVALVTVTSGIGVCERCSVGSGGVYSMISTVLGGRVGGTVGLLYVFGQCVAGAMYITGFAESIADVLSFNSVWAVRGISFAVLLGLLGINLAGVKWIIRLQLLLLAVLAVSTLDFVVGTFSHLDPEHGFVGYSEELLQNNTLPAYSPGESFFTVFGVFFPAATGVMAGFNMSPDLQKPDYNIPVGSLAAIGISWFLYLVFVFLLGAICTREALRYDFLIAEKVSLVGFLFLLGLYISSLASCMGGLYGAPRILQCIAEERVIPLLGFLGQGRGPNKTPVAAICLTSLITMAFIFIGQVNILAPIVTINFMLTYSFIDYSYFSVSMSYKLQMKLRKPLPPEGSAHNSSKPLILTKHSRYGTDDIVKTQRNGTLLEFTKDMDQIFQSPGPATEKAEKEKESAVSHRGKFRKSRKPAKQMLMDSFQLEFNSSKTADQENGEASGTEVLHSGGWSEAASNLQGRRGSVEEGFQMGDPHMTDLHLHLNGEKQESPHQQLPTTELRSSQDQSLEGLTEKQKLQGAEIQQLPTSLHTRLCNHWVSLIGAICSVAIMFVIQWIYAIANIAMATVLYFYIGQANPGLPTGVSANFSFFKWLQSSLKTMGRRGPAPQDQIVVTPSFAAVGMETQQLTEENADFASRDRYHHSSIITGGELTSQLQ
ncbi:solute carrier family 12 member 8 [Lepisosteus oculatus]|uniref:solute carrier family 12 member 8 n=1 Tax=Lepisosteus oculatus TaxID=7918 RepID=UPI0035F51DAE